MTLGIVTHAASLKPFCPWVSETGPSLPPGLLLLSLTSFFLSRGLFSVAYPALKLGAQGALLTLTGGVATALPRAPHPSWASHSLSGGPQPDFLPFLVAGNPPEVSVNGVGGEQPTQTNAGST